MTNKQILDVSWDMDDHDDGLLVTKKQEISDQFLQDLADARLASKDRAGEYHHVASIPVVVVEKWLREGFDIWRETPQAILKKLRNENLEAFIATNKRI